jgi:hypothetical protein
MKHFVVVLVAVLILACFTSAQTQQEGEKCKFSDDKLATLIREYRELRERRRRLPEGEFDKDVHADGGKLSKVLSALGAELGRPPYTKENIVSCLGVPDAIRSGEQMNGFLDIYHRELKKAGKKVEEKSGREYLVYHWRGWHDFLFFISEGGVIVDHGWWFAYE